MVEALEFAVFRHHGDAQLHGVHGRADVSLLAVYVHIAAGTGREAEDTLHRFAAAGADQAGKADDLALAHFKGHVFDARALLFAVADVFALQHDFGVFHVIARVVLIQFAADHHGDQFVARGFLNYAGADIAAVAQNRHAVADLVQLAHLVGDVDDAHALRRQIAHDLKQRLHFAVGDGGGRLVHDQYAAVEGDGLDDLHHLLLGDAQIGDQGVGVDAQIEAVEHLLGVGAHLGLVDAEGAHGLAAQEDVFRHRHVRHQHQFLMDDGDAVGARGIDARDGDLLSVDEDLAFFGDVDAAKHLNQRRLARAVFAQQRVDLAGFELEVHILQGFDAGERLADVFHFEQILAHRVSPPFLLHERAARRA